MLVVLCVAALLLRLKRRAVGRCVTMIAWKKIVFPMFNHLYVLAIMLYLATNVGLWTGGLLSGSSLSSESEPESGSLWQWLILRSFQREQQVPIFCDPEDSYRFGPYPVHFSMLNQQVRDASSYGT